MSAMMRAPRWVDAPSFAKVNLGLEVGRRRPDGYHELVTIYQSVALHDRLRFRVSARSGIRLRASDPSVPVDRSNLVARAYRALVKEAGRLPGVEVEIEKRIPVGGGMGGGSGNAGTTLLVLDRLLRLGLPRSRLVEVGADLGSDVPFFLQGGTALGLGRGERVVPLPDLPRMWLLLVFPGAPLSTGSVYAQARKLRKRHGLTPMRLGSRIFDFLSRAWEGPDALASLCNDLAPAASTLISGYDRIVRRLRDTGAVHVLLSGSGSTLFGVYRERSEAESALRKLPTLRGQVTRTMGRQEYLRRLLSGVS